MEQKKPRRREVTHVSGGNNVYRRGEGLGTGPVGTGHASSSHTSSGHSSQNHNQQYSEIHTSSGVGTGRPVVRGGKGGILKYVIILVVLLLGGGGGFSLLSGGQSTDYFGSDYSAPSTSSSDYVGTTGGFSAPSALDPSVEMSSGGSYSLLEALLSGANYFTAPSDFGGYAAYSEPSYNSYSETNTVKPDTTVASGSRDKRTQILGNGKDTVTIMVYMCGTDLESQNGMASADIQEMANAKIADNVNLLVYTGGCKRWNNNIVSSSVNQIYQVKSGGVKCLEKDCGTGAMIDPKTLTSFINYCTKNFPANRQELIFWDHGGGSLSGYGYDEKYARSGAMSLAGIKQALTEADTTFDFIGFDACLMATVENGLMLADYADYMIASEETEPGVGWYYTDWLTNLSQDTGKDTVLVGQNIVDDFITVCARKCQGQKATLSVVDLAELSNTVPEKLSDFSAATTKMIMGDGYKTVSTARNNAKEFAQSSKIDQIDLAHFAMNVGSDEGKELADALQGSVKYNRTAVGINNAYGLSVYFPYKYASKVGTATDIYNKIGMDSEYAGCIKAFAKAEGAGQMYPDGYSSPLSSLLGSLYGGRALPVDRSAVEMSISQEDLVWTSESDGIYRIKLNDYQWESIASLDLNVFYDDGSGYIDLGLDNVYELDGRGNIMARYDHTWMSIDGQIVPYYHLDTEECGNNYAITGYVPVYLNGVRAELLLTFDNTKPEGYIAGARYVYPDGESDTIAKNMIAVGKGDRLDFVCDYYSYDGEFLDDYFLGEPITLTDNTVIGNADIGDGKVKVTYRFTDLFQQEYWSDVMPE